MTQALYSSNVFVNCPFDDDFIELRNAMIFAIYDCGFRPRCALEEDNSGNVRFEKIQRLIKDSKFGIHDISRTELDVKNELPRFNMPLELGVFLGAQKFGNGIHKHKNCLIVDKEPYRYQKYLSDIAGHDVRSHENNPDKLIELIRNWLDTASGRKKIPGGKAIAHRYRIFKNDLPSLCTNAKIHIDDLTYNNYSQFVSEWLKLVVNVDIRLDEAVKFYSKMREIAQKSPYEAILHSWRSTEAAALDFLRKAGIDGGDNPPTERLIVTLSNSGLIDKDIERWLRNLFGIRNEAINAPMRYNYDDAMAYVDLSGKAIVALRRIQPPKESQGINGVRLD